MKLTVFLVLLFNLVSGLAYLYGAWRIWCYKQALSQAADILISVEASVHQVLHNAPYYIYKGQSGSRVLREKYKALSPQLQRARQAWLMVQLGLSIWQGTGRAGKSGKRRSP